MNADNNSSEQTIPNEKSINLGVLTKDFSRYYREFDEDFKKTTFHKPSGKNMPCFVAFGISGAGKSTTIARLLSDLSPPDFYEIIQDRKGERKEFCSISDITIGHTALSTTVVPRVYNAGNLQICDMPGFAETDPQKKITIDVLQKCFLTRVPDCTFLVIADMNFINNTKCETLMQNYHAPLAELLGDQYVSSLSHLYFVLTKNQELQYDSTQVCSKLTDIVLEILDENPLGSRFLKRMAKRHVIVDLEQDDNISLLTKINDMIETDQKSRETIGRVDQWKIEKLAAGENTLNLLCCSYVAKVTRDQNKLRALLDKQMAEIHSTKLKIKEQIDMIRAKNHTALQHRKEHEDDLAIVKEKIGNYEPARSNLVWRKKEAQEILEVHKKQTQLFAEHFVRHDFINYRCDVSEAYTKKLKMKQGYKVSINADMSDGEGGEQLILILESDGAEEAIKKAIGNGTMLPEALTKIEKLSGDNVLFNSKTHTNHCEAAVNQRNGIISVHVEWQRLFKVFIYSSRQFKELRFFSDFKKMFDSDVIKDEKSIQHLAGQIKQLDKDNQHNLRALKDLEDLVAKSNDGLDVIRASAEKEREQCEETLSGVKAEVARLSDMVQALQHDENVKKIINIEGIFRRNKIANGVSGPLERLLTAFVPMETSLSSAMTDVDRFRGQYFELFNLPEELLDEE